MIAALFGFEYKWEVYTPILQRKYGYYILPVLCGTDFIGRIEFNFDKKAKCLTVVNFWPEDGRKVSAVEKHAMKQALKRFEAYLKK